MCSICSPSQQLRTPYIYIFHFYYYYYYYSLCFEIYCDSSVTETLSFASLVLPSPLKQKLKLAYRTELLRWCLIKEEQWLCLLMNFAGHGQTHVGLSQRPGINVHHLHGAASAGGGDDITPNLPQPLHNSHR